MESAAIIDPPMITPVSLPQQQQVASGSEPADVAPERLPAFAVERLSIFYGEKKAIEDVTLTVPSKMITAIIGPSGCGKSTLLRSLNRMHELAPNTRIEGKVLFAGDDIYAPEVDPVVIRRRIGMVFQKSNPFPTMSIAENVLVGLKLNGVRDRAFLRERLEQSLRMAALWCEGEKKLHKPGITVDG